MGRRPPPQPTAEVSLAAVSHCVATRGRCLLLCQARIGFLACSGCHLPVCRFCRDGSKNAGDRAQIHQKRKEDEIPSRVLAQIDGHVQL
uniref:Uncharacterized protein n=1 Tax=Hordeum vulgare subsp. vulgare TaxID=112509 RepID=A0A8I6YML8_HORVV